jgi:hypothetical protein
MTQGTTGPMSGVLEMAPSAKPSAPEFITWGRQASTQVPRVALMPSSLL